MHKPKEMGMDTLRDAEPSSDKEIDNPTCPLTCAKTGTVVEIQEDLCSAGRNQEDMFGKGQNISGTQRLLPVVTTESLILEAKDDLIKSGWWGVVKQDLERARDGRIPFALQVLGIGSFQGDIDSIYQFACALLIKEELGYSSECTITDPVLTEGDIKIVTEEGFDVVPIQENAILDPPWGFCKVLFMPHCGLDLNIDAIGQCSLFHYEGVVFLGNSFSFYAQPPVHHQFPLGIIGELYKANAVVERICPKADDPVIECSFSDLAVITFTEDANGVIPPEDVTSVLTGEKFRN